MWLPSFITFHASPEKFMQPTSNKESSVKKEKEPERSYEEGYAAGQHFAREEAEFRELSAIVRAGDIPANWDIFRAEILNQYLGQRWFHFKSYAAGFTRACVEFYEEI